MAATIIASAMNAEAGQSMHPFFTRTKGRAHGTDSDNENTSNPPFAAVHGPDIENENPQRKYGHGTTANDDQQLTNDKTQTKIGETVYTKILGKVQEDISDHVSLEPDLNSARKKRRRTSEHVYEEMGSKTGMKDQNPEIPNAVGHRRGSSPIVLVAASSPLPEAQSAKNGHVDGNESSVTIRTPPKKVLRLNANGKFSSPPTKNPKNELSSQSDSNAPRRRGRPRRSLKPVSGSHLIVKFKYGSDDIARKVLGDKINSILAIDGTVRAEAQSTPKKVAKSRLKGKTPQKQVKPLHPFFDGRPGEQQPKPPVKLSPRKTSAVTPGKLRIQALCDRLHETNDVPFSSALLRDRLMTRHPGSKDAPFPAKGQVHTRGLQSQASPLSQKLFPIDDTVRRRKRKQIQVPLRERESLLYRFTKQLTLEEGAKIRDDGFQEPDPSIHIPERLLLSGVEIARKVAKELSVDVSDCDGDELSSLQEKQPHPAIQELYRKIPAYMTAYDDSRGEGLSWTLKYAPQSAESVLQPESEMRVLKGWLKSLAVQAVIGAATIPEKPAISIGPGKPKKKRRKRADDMNDFLVDSDEEVHEMGELQEAESQKTTIVGRKSVVQTIQSGAKLSNALLLSGPSGCGKTAAAHAVAKELGFKVFEISPNERRSGRDVLDKVGNMTENHLVRHHGTDDAAGLSGAEENSRIEDAFQNDLRSGKQGQMDAFFKPQGAPKMSSLPKAVKEKEMKAVQEVLKKQPKDQQQSVILLEEIDILFREDKEFWSTVMKLITTSKRPFIMTCNDEELVPLQALNLHAILRLSPPSVDLATDYMLLMAAAEGHLISRQAVATLYRHQVHDLRSTIAELDYWCQMGVGDPRCGLGWIYQRWPPGSDLDREGKKLRVVSKGTYHEGLGLMPKFADPEDSLLWSWAEFDVQPTTALGWEDLPETFTFDTGAMSSRRALQHYADFADSLSAAHAWPTIALSNPDQMDPTQPELPEKARGNYIEGMTLLQTDEAIDYSGTGEALLVSQLVATSRVYKEVGLDTRPPLSSIELPGARHESNRHLSRSAFACFDAISVPADGSASPFGFQPSVFDGTLRTIATDLAPYIRSIVQYDQALEEQRHRLDLLTTDGAGRKAKRARTTRAARSALEGGQRSNTRRERWFTSALDMDAVLATGGRGWPRALIDAASLDGVSRDGVETDGTEPPVVSNTREDDEEIKYEPM